MDQEEYYHEYCPEEIERLLIHQIDVLARARDAFFKMEGMQKSIEGRLIDKAPGKSVAEREIKGMADEAWLEFHVKMRRLKGIYNYQQDRLELLNKQWLSAYARNKDNAQAIRKQV